MGQIMAAMHQMSAIIHAAHAAGNPGSFPLEAHFVHQLDDPMLVGTPPWLAPPLEPT